MKDFERVYRKQPVIHLPGRSVDLAAGQPTVRPQSIHITDLGEDVAPYIYGAGYYGSSKYGACTYQTATTSAQLNFAVYA